MALGVSAFACRLDDLITSGGGGVDWDNFAAWRGSRPVFAGKYLAGHRYRWVHGEATTLVDPLVNGASLSLAPLFAGDPVRLATAGEPGRIWGSEDGKAVAAAIQAALRVGNLALPAKQTVYVYLDVPAGTALDATYWNGFATAVTDSLIVAADAGGAGVQCLLPCVTTPFTASGGHWAVPQAITAALDQPAGASTPGPRCHGLWAITPDTAPITPTPTLDWSTLLPYSQAQGANKVLVPVRIWRYATGNPKAPVNQVGAMTLEATQPAAGTPDPALDGMLSVRAWTADQRPTQVGVDRGYLLDLEAKCLAQRKITVTHLPEGSPVNTAGPAITPLAKPISFVARYYSTGATTTGNAPRYVPHDLNAAETAALGRAGVDICTAWEGHVDYAAIPTHLATAGVGAADGTAAAWYAAHVAGQRPHTPIYFAVDCDVTTSGTGANGKPCLSDASLITYFSAVADGLAKYLHDESGLARVPYAVGVYACAHALDVLYTHGLASHFWQAYPPVWGDQNGEERTNGTAWLHANAWQVGMDYAPDVQIRSGVMGCRRYSWQLTYANAGGPSKLDIVVGTTTTTVAFPPKSWPVKGARAVRWVPKTGYTAVRFDFAADPKTFKLIANPAMPAGWDAALVRVDKDGYADLDVAWGDPGGWRPPAPGGP